MLSDQTEESGKGPIWALFAPGFVLFCVIIWPLRLPAAARLAERLCDEKGLSCAVRVVRLDPGGAAIDTLTLADAGSTAPTLVARDIRVSLDWPTPWAPRTAEVRIGHLLVTVNASGEGPALGRLDGLIAEAMDGARPRIDGPDILIERFVADVRTAFGPVAAEGRASVSSAGQASADVAVRAPSLRWAGGPGRLPFAPLDVAGLSAMASLRPDGAGHRISGQLSARTAALSDIAAAELSATYDADIAAGDPAAASGAGDWLANLAGVRLSAQAAAVQTPVAQATEARVRLALLRDGPKITGTMSAALGEMTGALYRADGADVSVTIEARADAAPAIDAEGSLGVIGAQWRGEAPRDLAAPVVARALPPAAAVVVGAAIDGLSRDFRLDVPFRLQVDDGRYRLALKGSGGAEGGGWRFRLGTDDGPLVAELGGAQGAWSASGALEGEYADALRLTMAAQAAGGDSHGFKLSGSAGAAFRGPDTSRAQLHIGDVTVVGEGAAGLRSSGRLSLDVDLGADGPVRGARMVAPFDLLRTGDATLVSVPRGVEIEWEAIRVGDMRISASSAHVGFVRPVRLGVSGAAEAAGSISPLALEGELGPNAFSVRTSGASFRLTGGSAPRFMLAVEGAQAATADAAVMVPALPVSVSLGAERSASASLRDGSATVSGIRVEGVSADLFWRDADGVGAGSAKRLRAEISDTFAQSDSRFQPLVLDGDASFDGGALSFGGRLALAGAPDVGAGVALRHSLAEGVGAVTVEPFSLLFSPSGLQPSRLSNRLRGPANVDGRVTLSGGADWSPEGIRSAADIDIDDIGFVLAGAGEFSGVSGRVKMDDVLGLRSQAGQEIRIDSVRLGLPIRDGKIRFQLMGPEQIRIESAEWPFADGVARILPVDFVFAADRNVIIAEADRWSLSTLAGSLSLSDLEIEGIVSGRFPLVLSTGSARIENALLEAADDGGVIRYRGSTGEAASAADDNAKLVFDALSDFRYRIMKIGLNGDLAGRMDLTLDLLGANPSLLGGAPFDLNIAINASPTGLMDVLATSTGVKALADVVEQNAVKGSDPD
jgi:hypothetical protein